MRVILSPPRREDKMQTGVDKQVRASKIFLCIFSINWYMQLVVCAHVRECAGVPARAMV